MVAFMSKNNAKAEIKRSITADDLLTLQGVIVRSAHGMGLPRHIRVTAGTMPQNQRFIAALKEVLASSSNHK